MSDKEDIAILAFGCGGLIPAVLAGYVLRGWALVTLWGWFLTPVFHVAPPNYATAFGLGILGSMITGTADMDCALDKEKTAKQRMCAAYGKLLLRAPVAVGTGWIVKHWV